jgi:hypothetical protein
MEGKPITENTQAYKVDKWKSDGFTKLGVDLVNSIKNKDWYYGIPCECCNSSCKNFLLNLIDVPYEQFTYANLWVNSNYSLFMDWIKKIDSEVVIIANKNAKNNLDDFPFKVSEFFPIEDDCVNYYEKNSDELKKNLKKIAEKHKKTLFFISAGPLSEVIIDYLYKNNSQNKYIDVGSSLDEFIHKKKTRPYMMTGDLYNIKTCFF